MTDRVDFFDKAFCSLASGGAAGDSLHLTREALTARELLFDKATREWREIQNILDTSKNWITIIAETPFGEAPIIVDKELRSEIVDWLKQSPVHIQIKR